MYLKKPNKGELIVMTAILVWFVIVNIIAVIMGIVGWPMFFVTIFFFTLHSDMKQVPNIFCGGTMGLLMAYALKIGLEVFTPMIGDLAAFTLVITLILGLILIGGTFAPVVFNNVAFAYMTVATTSLHTMTFASIMNNILVLLVGGGLILAGTLGFMKVVMNMMPKEEAKK